MSSVKENTKIAIVDLGSNSVRLFIYSRLPNNEFELFLTEKFMVKLGEGVFESKILDPQAIKRTLDALKIFKYLIDKNNVQSIHSFGTCALRNAENANEFIQLVKEETSININIISGEREAQLIAKGLLTDPDLPSNNEMFFVDIGGGSTEISYIKNNTVIDSYSFELGSNRLAQSSFRRFYEEGPNKEKKLLIKELRQFCQEQLLKVIKKKNWKKTDIAVGSSGTIKAYQRILRKHNLESSPFKYDHLEECVNGLTKLSLSELISVPGLQEKRLDQIVAGGILLDEILKELGSQYIYTSKFSLRDGVIAELS